MSDMTALFHEYEASADFAQHINAAVLQLKKWHFGTPDFPKPDEQALREARRCLADVLLGLTERLSAADVTTADGAAVVIPEDIIERVEAKHKNRLAYFIADLRDASTALASDISLTKETLETLDEICDAADASASASFRRLRRR